MTTLKQQAIIQGKANALFEHLVYSLATGRWQIGERLPSVREAEKEWAVNRLTVLASYRRLESAGLIEVKERSGYFVLGGSSLDDLSRHRYELDNIYTKVLQLLEQETSLLPSTVFKSLAELSSFRIQLQPEIAFIECSHYQADYHAKECQQRLNISIVPLSLDALDNELPFLQPSIRCLLTTGFHFHQISHKLEKLKLPVVNVVIQIDQQKLQTATEGLQQLCVFERDMPIGESIQQDVCQLLDKQRVSLQISDNMDADVENYLAFSANNTALLPPRVYGRLTISLQQNCRVIPIDYKITENQWQQIAKSLKLSMSWFIASN